MKHSIYTIALAFLACSVISCQKQNIFNDMPDNSASSNGGDAEAFISFNIGMGANSDSDTRVNTLPTKNEVTTVEDLPKDYTTTHENSIKNCWVLFFDAEGSHQIRYVFNFFPSNTNNYSYISPYIQEGYMYTEKGVTKTSKKLVRPGKYKVLFLANTRYSLGHEITQRGPNFGFDVQITKPADRDFDFVRDYNARALNLKLGKADSDPTYLDNPSDFPNVNFENVWSQPLVDMPSSSGMVFSNNGLYIERSSSNTSDIVSNKGIFSYAVMDITVPNGYSDPGNPYMVNEKVSLERHLAKFIVRFTNVDGANNVYSSAIGWKLNKLELIHRAFSQFNPNFINTKVHINDPAAPSTEIQPSAFDPKASVPIGGSTSITKSVATQGLIDLFNKTITAETKFNQTIICEGYLLPDAPIQLPSGAPTINDVQERWKNVGLLMTFTHSDDTTDDSASDLQVKEVKIPFKNPANTPAPYYFTTAGHPDKTTADLNNLVQNFPDNKASLPQAQLNLPASSDAFQKINSLTFDQLYNEYTILRNHLYILDVTFKGSSLQVEIKVADWDSKSLNNNASVGYVDPAENFD